ncbi:hypothetical protein Pcinc_005773 [Petrolisthes cinctipes]|uniref:Uncharacterized protein n=1 Tax=Petrolisthes cinctipes TaxID=88211 RepID=A0AAE1GEF5_PETCI|nr:hypothetical protein Pcinc_005773 [Petrolisthes cinctipes]
MLALIETEAIEGIAGPFKSEDITADEPLPSTSAGSVVRPMPLTGTLDEHAPQPNEPQSTSGAARASIRPLAFTTHRRGYRYSYHITGRTHQPTTTAEALAHATPLCRQPSATTRGPNQEDRPPPSPITTLPVAVVSVVSGGEVGKS